MLNENAAGGLGNFSNVRQKYSRATLDKVKQGMGIKSELLDKITSKVKLDSNAAISSRNKGQLTAQESGALARTSPDFMDYAQQAADSSYVGSIVPSAKKELNAKRLYDFRSSNDYLFAREIANSAKTEELDFFSLLKETEKTRNLFASSTGDERARIGAELNNMIAALENQEPQEFNQDTLNDPYYLDHVDMLLSRHQEKAVWFDYAEDTVRQAEELQKEIGWLEDAEREYTALPPEEQRLMRQELLFDYANGSSAVNFNVGDEYALFEEQALDLKAGQKLPDGTVIPNYQALAQKDQQTFSELKQLVELSVEDARGTDLYDRAKRNAQMDLDYLDGQALLAEGLTVRYAPEADQLAKQGKEQFDAQFPLTYRKVMEENSNTPLWKTEEEWTEKLRLSAEKNKGTPDAATLAEYEKAYQKAATGNYQNLMASEIFGEDTPMHDYFRVPLMTEMERKTFYAYFAQNPDKAHQYAQALDYTLSKRASVYQAEADQAMASGDLWQQAKAAGTSVLLTPFKMMGTAYAISSRIQGKRIDPYAASFTPAMQQETVRTQLKQNAIDKYGADSTATKAIHFLMDVGLGAADSLLAARTMGLVGYSIVGGTDAGRGVLLRGGSEDQAWNMAAAMTFAEIVTEKIPFDNLNKGFSTGFTLRGLAVSVGGETLGESMSSLIGERADRRIMMDQSFFETAIDAYEESGLSPDDARKQANKDALMDVLYEGAVGGVAGGLSYGVAGGIGSIKNSTRPEQKLMNGAVTPADVGGTLSGIMAEFRTGGNRPQADRSAQIAQLESQAAEQEAMMSMRRAEQPAQEQIAPEQINQEQIDLEQTDQNQIEQTQTTDQPSAIDQIDQLTQDMGEMGEQADSIQATLDETQAQIDAWKAQQTALDTGIQSQVDRGTLDPDTAGLIEQAFPQSIDFQREALRFLASHDMTLPAQAELIQSLQEAQQADGSIDYDSPSMQTVAERAMITARLHGMIRAEAITMEPKPVNSIAPLLQTARQEGDAFNVIDSLARQMAAGQIDLKQAALGAYRQLDRMAQDLGDAQARGSAIEQAAANMQILTGQYGAKRLRDFMMTVLKQVDSTEYQAQQMTMNNIQDAALLPPVAPSRSLLDSMIQEQSPVTPQTLGELNRMAAQDLSAPEYQEAVENNRVEAEIARIVASEIGRGAMKDLDSRSVQIDALEKTAKAAQSRLEQADAALEQVNREYQGFTQTLLQTDLIDKTLIAQQKEILQRMRTAKAEQQSTAAVAEKSQSAYEAADTAYQSEYADRLNEIRKAAAARRIAELEAQAVVEGQTPAQEQTPLKTAKNANNGISQYPMNAGMLAVEMPTVVSAPGPVRSANAIFADLGKALNVPYNVNRKQYLREQRGQAAGYFVNAESTVHSQNAQDVNVAAHEFGHWLDQNLRLGSHPVISEVVATIQRTAPDYARQYNPNELAGEAMAEVVKIYMVNRDQAVRNFGYLITDMEAGMKQANVFKAFESARLDLERTLTADVMRQTEARLQMEDGSAKVRDLLSTTTLERLRTKLFDHTIPLAKLTKAEMEVTGENFQYSTDSRQIALKNNRIDNYVRQNFEGNLVDVYGNVVMDRSFSDNFKDIQDLKGFSNYLLLNHELDRSRVGKSIYKNQFTTEQVRTTIADYERANPTWSAARMNLNEWYDAFMKEYLVKPGILTQRQYQTMHRMYPNYVPTYRVMDSAQDGFRGSRDAQKGLQRAGLSDLDIKNPIENMGRQIVFYTRQAHRLHLANVFADQIDRLGDMGYIAEKAQPDMNYSPEIDRLIRNAQERAAQYKDALTQADPTVDMDALNNLEALLLNTAREAVFTVSDQATGSNVINILGQDGNYRSYVVHDQGVLDVIANTEPQRTNALLRFAGRITRMISVTATSANALFAATNAMRDMFTQVVYGSVSTNPGTEVAKWLTMLPQTWMASHGKGKYTEAYRQFETMAEMGSKYSMQIGRSTQAMMEAATQPRSVKNLARSALKMVTLQNLNELIENNTRFLEFTQGKSALGGKNIDNLGTYEGRLRAMIAAGTVTVDFARHGSSMAMRELATLTPFLNASLQGIHKTLSIFAHENQGRRGQIATKFVVNGLMLGVISQLLLNMMLDDKEKKEYEEFDEGFKSTNVFVKLGKESLLRIPLPQDSLFQTLYAGGRMLANAYDGTGNTEPDALISTGKAILGEQFNFSFVFSPMLNIRENRTWYGGQIEPYWMEELPKAQRYDDRTTEAAKWLGDKLKINNEPIMSPQMWDYFLPQYTGIYGRLAVNTMQSLNGDKPLDEAFVDTIQKQVASRFTSTPAFSTQIYNNYKENVTSMEGIVALSKLGRAIPNFDTGLTQDEVNQAVREADQMLKKGGALYDLKQEINGKWDEYMGVVDDKTLTNEERDAQSKQLRQDINMLGLQGNGIIAEYENKYFVGAARLDTRTVDNNLTRLAPEGFGVTKVMGDDLFRRFNEGDKTAKTLYDLAERYDNTAFVDVQPSMTWKGFDEIKADERRVTRINDTYYRVLGQELTKNSVSLNSASLSEERAKQIISDAKSTAAEAARVVAFEGTDQKYTVDAKGWYKDAASRKNPTAKIALDLAKQHDDPYYLSRYPSFNWTGFDADAASPMLKLSIERAYYDVIEQGLWDRSAELQAADKETARKIMESISADAADAARKVALGK